MAVQETIFFVKKNGKIVRPFSNAARVTCRGRSFLLQKVLVDFGAAGSFAEAAERVKTHYGVDVASSTTRLDVEKHAKNMRDMDEQDLFHEPQKEAPELIGQIDGCMIPIVSKKEGAAASDDQRKNKSYEWKEARLALAKPKGKINPTYTAVIGSIDEAGNQLAKAVKRSGEGEKTKIHCVGDGAPWIAEQVEQRFGSKAYFLLDFYHASQYLAQAAMCCQPDTTKDWLHDQQELLKAGKAQAVLENLEKHNFEACLAKDGCHALKCFNYLSRRLGQLDYKRAIDADLPIGSGEIESGHRSVIQQRLKLPGAWWSLEKAKDMIALRIARANGYFLKYWNMFLQQHRSFVYG